MNGKSLKKIYKKVIWKSQCEVKDGDNKQNKIQKYYIGEKEVRRTIK